MIERLQAVYAIEAEIRGLSAEQRLAARRSRAAPLMDALKARLTAMVGHRAINYALNHWDGLTLFLSDGRVEVDTNTVERSMRPIAMGRRNSLFSASEGGAESWAILASLVNTAKLHGLDPTGLSRRRARAHRLRADQEPPAARASGLELEGCPRTYRKACSMNRRRRRATATAMSLQDLERWLQERAERQPIATSIAMLDGYVAAIVPAPYRSALDWICPLLAVDADAFNHGGTPEFAAISAVARHHNDTSNTLSTAPHRFQLMHQRKPNGDVDARPWCQRFHAAMRLRLPAWTPLLDLSSINHGQLVPIRSKR